MKKLKKLFLISDGVFENFCFFDNYCIQLSLWWECIKFRTSTPHVVTIWNSEKDLKTNRNIYLGYFSLFWLPELFNLLFDCINLTNINYIILTTECLWFILFIYLFILVFERNYNSLQSPEFFDKQFSPNDLFLNIFTYFNYINRVYVFFSF